MSHKCIPTLEQTAKVKLLDSDQSCNTLNTQVQVAICQVSILHQYSFFLSHSNHIQIAHSWFRCLSKIPGQVQHTNNTSNTWQLESLRCLRFLQEKYINASTCTSLQTLPFYPNMTAFCHSETSKGLKGTKTPMSEKT